MRLAYVCLDPGVPVFGNKGSSVHCQEIMRAFRRRGFEIELFATRMGDNVPADLEDVKRHHLRRKPGANPADPADREKSLARLNPLFYHNLDLAEPFDVVYERYSLWSFSSMQFAYERKIPGILEVNSPLILEQKTWRTLVDEEAAKHARCKCFRFATSMIAVSDKVASQLHRNYFAQDKTTVIPNGVDCRKFRPARAASRRFNKAKTVIGFVGSLKPWHGVANLISAYALAHNANPDVMLRIVGEGPERPRLEAQLRDYSPAVQDSVEWLGAISNAEVPGVMSTFDIAVAPYPELPDFYFSPLKILEYMAAGLPIVASCIGQIPKLIEQDVTGLLVNPGCEQELASSILRLCREPQLRTELGRAARDHVKANHTWQSVADRILETVPATMLHSGTC